MGLAAAAIGVGAVASVGGALIQSNAAQSAAKTQANAEQQAEKTQVQSLNEASTALAPYNQIGTGAENQLANLYGIPYNATGTGAASTSSTGVTTPVNVNAAASSPGGASVQDAAYANFANSPNYKFAFDQGMQALQRSAAAGGTLVSGGQLKAGQEFGQGLATQQYQNYVSGLQSLASGGQNAAAGTASNAISGGNSVANTQEAVGQSQASGALGSASALAGGLNGISSSVMSSLLLSKLGGATPTAYAPAASLATANPFSGIATALGGGDG